MKMNLSGHRWKAAIAAALLLASAGCSGGGQSAATAPASPGGNSNPPAAPQSGSTESQVAKGIELGKNGPVTIDFWHIQATIYGDAIKEMVSEFNKEI